MGASLSGKTKRTNIEQLVLLNMVFSFGKKQGTLSFNHVQSRLGFIPHSIYGVKFYSNSIFRCRSHIFKKITWAPTQSFSMNGRLLKIGGYRIVVISKQSESF